ncbi:Pycsar system effector family protein [Actinoplanes sp. NPDC020271]|uniref:Pycsar system effector family protein n=1 Tax=Actinoplanes sp. NPDC020271 TaxID=3363896 RepID=UPI0037A781B1
MRTLEEFDLEHSKAIDQAFTEVQAQISRVDTKASILTGLALGGLTGGAALVSKAHLHGIALATAVMTAVLTGAAIALLGAAIRPALGGNYGFMRWAFAPTDEALYWDLRIKGYENKARIRDRLDDDIASLRHLARSARRKYQRVRLAVDLLGAALGCAALTAFLSALD